MEVAINGDKGYFQLSSHIGFSNKPKCRRFRAVIFSLVAQKVSGQIRKALAYLF